MGSDAETGRQNEASNRKRSSEPLNSVGRWISRCFMLGGNSRSAPLHTAGPTADLARWQMLLCKFGLPRHRDAGSATLGVGGIAATTLHSPKQPMRTTRSLCDSNLTDAKRHKPAAACPTELSMAGRCSEGMDAVSQCWSTSLPTGLPSRFEASQSAVFSKPGESMDKTASEAQKTAY